jgi:hypothetical protein
MSKIFCGAGKMPKTSRVGTSTECAEKNQIRYYGLNKVDPKTIERTKKKEHVPDTREKLFKLMFKLKGTIGRNKGRYEGAKDEKAKAEYYKLWQDAEKELKVVMPKLEKVEAERKKTEAKTNKTDEKKKVVKSKSIK